MVGSSIGTIDHGIGGAGELIVQTALDQSTDDRIGWCPIMHREGAGVGRIPVPAHRAVHRLDDVAADREVAKRLFGRSEEHTSELQSLMRTSSAVLCWKQQQVIRGHLQNTI